MNLRRHLSKTLPLGAAAAAVWWVLRSFDSNAFLKQARTLDGAWIAFAVLLDIATYVAQGFRWRSLLRPSVPVTLFQTTRAIYAGLLLNEVAPFRPGEVIRGLLISRQSGVAAARILPTMVAERLMDGACLTAAILAASFWIPALQPARPVLAAVCGLAGLAAAGLRRRIPRQWLRSLKNPRALALSAAALLSQGAAVWCVVRACHVPLPLLAGVGVMLVIRAGTLLPGAPANIGTHQLSTMLGLSMFGIPAAAAAPIAIILFAVLTLPLVAAGSVALLTTRASRRGELAGA